MKIETAVIWGVVVAFVALIAWGAVANVAWAPHAADIRLEELRTQQACIAAGGIPEDWTGCKWSRGA